MAVHKRPNIMQNNNNNNNNNNRVHRRGTKIKPQTMCCSSNVIQSSFCLPDCSFTVYQFLVLLAALFCYVNSFNGGLVHDDIFAIKNNDDVRPSTPLSNIFHNDFWGKSMQDNMSHKSYRPLCTLTFRLNYMFGGLDPFGYHLTNVVLHMIVSCLFTHCINELLFHDSKASFIAGLLFATHPIHTEAVAGVVGRADILACLFFLLTIFLYVRSVSTDEIPGGFPTTTRPGLFLVAIFLGATSMLIKEHGVTCLLVVVAYDVIVLCNKGITRIVQTRSITMDCAPLLKRGATCFITLCSLFMFRIWMMKGELPPFSDQDNPASYATHCSTRFLTFSYLCVFNVWLLLCPLILSYDWQMASIPLVESVLDIRNLATLLFFVILVGLTVYAIFIAKGVSQRAVLMGLVVLAIPFLPASNLFFRVGFVIAERILYIPSMGYCILLVHGLWNMCNKVGKPLSSAITFSVLLLVAMFAWRTVVRNSVWHSRESLFRSGVETLPHNAKAHYNYANYLKDVHRTEEAIHHYKITLKLYPNYASASNNLGTLLITEKPDVAKALFTNAIVNNPQHARAHFNLANVLRDQKIYDKAEAEYRASLRINADFSDAHINLGTLLLDLGRPKEARKHYLKSVTLSPDNADTFNNYGSFLSRIDEWTEAVEQYRRCLSLQPTHTVAMVNLARALRKLGHTEEVEDLYIRVLNLNSDTEVMKSLGALYFNTERPLDAKSLYETAIGIDPDSKEINTQYAQVIAKLGNMSRAITILKDVLAKHPNYSDAHQQISSIYGITGNHQQALQHINAALKLEPNMEGLSKSKLLLECGNHYRDLDKKQEALMSYKEAADLNPNNSIAQMNLGAMYHMTRDYKSARVHYEAAYKLDPNNDILLQNIKKLERRELALKKKQKPNQGS
ncbi:protein O-mannosyl-transferase TMTC1-like [Antedon mediterranea]|uniref:protein O-mannosyl-transferase TMTC1-like n=1 Tax=Antedon mediterranea TaxID=105859 RepID=UPI003AF97FF1